MGLSDPRYIFGITSFTPFNRTTGKFYTEMKVLAGSQFTLSGEQMELRGGSSKYPYAIEDGTINAELSLTSREYPAWGFELFLGKALTENAAELSGNVSSLTNESGASVFDASTGIATVTAGATVADLKFGKYIVEATSATEVKVYASSDIDFARGTDTTFTSDDMDIASGLTIVDAGGTTAVTSYNLVATGGSGTVGFTIGDTASFEVRPVNDGSYTASFGGSSDTYSEFGAVLYGQQHGSGRMIELTIHKLKSIGMPINFNANEFSEWEVTMKASYDSAKNEVFSMREVKI